MHCESCGDLIEEVLAEQRVTGYSTDSRPAYDPPDADAHRPMRRVRRRTMAESESPAQ